VSASDHAVALADVMRRLSLLYSGLSGQARTILPYANQDDPAQYPDSQDTIRLPAAVGFFADAEANTDWYRVAIAHRALHDTLGSYDYVFAADPAEFGQPRRRLDPPVADGAGDFERFFSLFRLRAFAEQLFTVLEDVRVEARAGCLLPGYTAAFRAARARERSDFWRQAGTPRQLFGDLLVTMSLEPEWTDVKAPRAIAGATAGLRSAVDTLRRPGATVQDTAEATIRVYATAVALPALALDPAGLVLVPVAAGELPAPEPARWPDYGAVKLEGDAALEITLRPVSYRDVMWPRFQAHSPAMPHHEPQIIRFLPGLPAAPGHDHGPPGHDHEHDHHHGEERSYQEEHGLHPVAHEHNEPFFDQPAPAEGALRPDGPGTAVYDEWDSARGLYRLSWCRVRERRVPARGGTDVFHRAVHRHKDVLPGLRAMVESLRPERYAPVGRQSEGSDIDLDAAIEAIIDLRTTGKASDGVYTARVPVERDVAVALLVDLSSSTAERLPPAAGETALFRDRPKVIDVEMDSVALLASVLDAVHDSFAVYGFSGRGRGDVRFEVFKEFEERLSAGVLSRFAAAVPIAGTRMGAAIRHATVKLRSQHEQTRLLIVLSDGRPYDHDYGQEYGDEAGYASRDVRAAIREAAGHGVRTFLLTVDKEGLDYLREVCGDGAYEVLDDVRRLPDRLLSLYRELTYA
jgi:hypothetical protein